MEPTVTQLTEKLVASYAQLGGINHLDGKLIIDFLSPLKRDMVVRKFKKLARTETL